MAKKRSKFEEFVAAVASVPKAEADAVERKRARKVAKKKRPRNA